MYFLFFFFQINFPKYVKAHKKIAIQNYRKIILFYQLKITGSIVKKCWKIFIFLSIFLVFIFDFPKMRNPVTIKIRLLYLQNSRPKSSVTNHLALKTQGALVFGQRKESKEKNKQEIKRYFSVRFFLNDRERTIFEERTLKINHKRRFPSKECNALRGLALSLIS